MLMFSVSLPDAIYKEPRQAAAFYRDLVDKLDRLPGVASSTAVMVPPVSASGFGGTFSIEGRAQPTGVDEPRAQLRSIEPGYFRTLGVPFTAGRVFGAHDDEGATPVAIISETAARRFWPGEDPIGRRLRMHVSATGPREPFREIVGIVADVKTSRLEAAPAPVVYVPHPQHPAGFMTVLVRTFSSPEAATGAALAVLRGLDPSLAPIRVRTMEDHVAASRSGQKFRAMLLGLFSACAFLLAIVGLYAITAYSTNRRRHEIGVRIALGATSRDIQRMVLAEGMRPVIAGVLMGCAAALAVSHLMAGLLFGVRPYEPSIVAGVAVLLAATAAAACYLPARSAAAADPRDSLRAE
jgi:putative ABC transport system permease protein